jgi:hypothetical protein
MPMITSFLLLPIIIEREYMCNISQQCCNIKNIQTFNEACPASLGPVEGRHAGKDLYGLLVPK